MRTAEYDPAQKRRVMIANRYEVDVSLSLGRGGMAKVYPGQDLKLRRPVAVKTLRPEYQRDPDSRQRFRSEARFLTLVSTHPNIVSLYDVKDAQNGSWIVMEYIDGPSLEQVLKDEGPLDPETVMAVLDQLGKALSYVHANGLVHLDVKPRNILQTPDGTFKLIDFGVAQWSGGPQEKIGDNAYGTAAYLAPEQASGGQVSPATDVYALGCVIYELLTGQTPFTAEGPEAKRELIRAHLNERPQAPSAVRPELALPAWIDDVLGWALAKNPEDRFQDVNTFVQMFDAGLSGEPPVYGPATTQRIPKPEQEDTRHDDIPDVQPITNTTVRRLYRRGGLLARRSRRAKRLLWRVLLILLVANLLMGAIVMIKQGPAAVTEQFLSVAPGTGTTVSAEVWNMRSAPGTSSPVVLVLTHGDAVNITGLSEKGEHGRWWPVETQYNGQTYAGWVREDGLKANAWTGRLSWMQGAADRVTSVKESIGSGVDRVKGLIPGMSVEIPAL